MHSPVSTLFTLLPFFATALATDVSVTLTDNTDGSLSQLITIPSGVCRTSPSSISHVYQPTDVPQMALAQT